MKRYSMRACPGCDIEQPINGLSTFCNPCGLIAGKIRLASANHVTQAIQAGSLQRARCFTCVDCGAPAAYYDHRRYLSPLDVVPVCPRCNHARGNAVDLVELVRQMRQWATFDRGLCYMAPEFWGYWRGLNLLQARGECSASLRA